MEMNEPQAAMEMVSVVDKLMAVSAAMSRAGYQELADRITKCSKEAYDLTLAVLETIEPES